MHSDYTKEHPQCLHYHVNKLSSHAIVQFQLNNIGLAVIRFTLY